MTRRREAGEPSSPEAARREALRLLGRREYTATELRRRLADRGFVSAHIDDVLSRLQDEGLQDDRRVAAGHVRVATEVKGRGPLRIRRELEARGIPAAMAADATAGASEGDVSVVLARLLARKRLVRPIPPADRRRLFQQLVRRGFPASSVAAALRLPPPEDD
jgi:regulatory protein